jgi:hypothetical protein
MVRTDITHAHLNSKGNGVSTDRIETFRRANPWQPEETPKRSWRNKPSTIAIVCGVVGFLLPILVWLIETGWFNLPPKAYELNNVKDDVAKIEKRLDTLDGRINRFDEKMDRKLDGITSTLEGLAEKTAATGAKLDALSVAHPPPLPSPAPYKPKKQPTKFGQR